MKRLLLFVIENIYYLFQPSSDSEYWYDTNYKLYSSYDVQYLQLHISFCKKMHVTRLKLLYSTIVNLPYDCT